jgi:carbonic anhydrase/acetyltransferase-like protein (isoleucine patch superfamily)
VSIKLWHLKNKYGMILTFKEKTPGLSKDVFIADNASVIGDVEIGDNSSVWFGSVIRGDIAPIRIGHESNIQDLTVIHVSRSSNTIMYIGDNVTVGHSVILHACFVSNACLIGMGSTILDDVVLGEESIVGAGALLSKGKTYPPRSMILGSPAQIIRTVSDSEVAAIYESSKIYVDLKNQYIR